jgi:hypothetical protein
MKRDLYIKDKNILNKNFYKEGGLVCSAHCSLCFHGLRIDNLCDVGPPFQAIYKMFKKCGNTTPFSIVNVFLIYLPASFYSLLMYKL